MSDLELKDFDLTESQFPIYSWSLGKQFSLSKTQKVCADTFIKERDFHKCIKTLKQAVNKDFSVHGIRNILGHPEVSEYVTEGLKVSGLYEGITKEALVVELMSSGAKMKPAEFFAKKEVAKIKGFYGPGGNLNANHIEISFTQSNGEK